MSAGLPTAEQILWAMGELGWPKHADPSSPVGILMTAAKGFIAFADPARFAELVSFKQDYTYDMKLARALVCERHLADIFAFGSFATPTIELKTERYLWERTGNIAFERRQNGHRSGVWATTASHWAHQMMASRERSLGHILLPMTRVHTLCERAGEAAVRVGGDRSKFEMYVIPLEDLWKP